MKFIKIKPWKTDIEGLENIEEDCAKFILEEAKDYLSKSIDRANSLDQKAFILLGFLMTIICALVGFFVSKYYVVPDWKILRPIGFMIISYALTGIALIMVVWPRSYPLSGNAPKNIYLKEVCESKNLKQLICGSLEIYQENIDIALKNNKSKGLWLILSIVLFFLTPYLNLRGFDLNKFFIPTQ